MTDLTKLAELAREGGNDFYERCSPDVVLALIARVRELEDMTKAGAHWEERAQEHRMRVRELESEVAQLKIDLNEARGADVESLRSLLARGGGK